MSSIDIMILVGGLTMAAFGLAMALTYKPDHRTNKQAGSAERII